MRSNTLAKADLRRRATISLLHSARMRATLGLVISLLAPGLAAADEGDGLYGRLDGDLTFSFALSSGAVVDPGGEPTRLAYGTEMRLRYVDTAGLLVAGELHPGGAERAVLALDL